MSDKSQAGYICTVSIENREMLSGYDKVVFFAVAWNLADDCLTFKLPGGSGKAFNWSKVVYFEAERESGG